MTNKQAYEILNKYYIHWSRKDAKHIIIWTSGYKTQEAHAIEALLRQAKMRIVEQEFDRMCGKTFSVFKHK